MTSRPLRRLAWLLPLCLLAPAHAFDADRYRAVDDFGPWTLLCDFEADMGHTTYFACALRSEAPVAVLFDGVGTPDVTAYVAADFAARSLTAPDLALDLSGCDGGEWCRIPGENGEALLTAAAAGQPVLIAGDVGLRRVPAAGLADAIAAAEALID